MFVPVPNCVEVELRHRLFDTPCETTVTFEEHAVAAGPTLESAVTAASLWWGTQMLPLLSSELQWIGVTVRSLASPGGPSIVVDLPTPLHGGIVTRSLTANVAARVNYLVANPPGGLKGCMFLPGVPGNQVAANTISQEWRDLVFEAANSLVDSSILEGWRWVVASRFHNGAPRAAGVTMRVVTAAITSNVVGQRRSRLHNEVLP